jgi:hypothetical protein
MQSTCNITMKVTDEGHEIDYEEIKEAPLFKFNLHSYLFRVAASSICGARARSSLVL